MKTVGEALGPAVDAVEDDKLDIRNLTQAQLMQLGMADLAYVKPVWMNGKFEPRQVLPLSLSYDHRLIDGADAARFLRWIAEAFEQPFLLSVPG